MNDPIALGLLAFDYYGKGDYESAFQNYSKAAALGNVGSVFNLSLMYRMGEGVEEDKDKARALLEKAAIGGHHRARYNLGVVEMENSRIDRAVMHWIIAANHGDDDSIKALKECYKEGNISKAEFAAALRAQIKLQSMKQRALRGRRRKNILVILSKRICVDSYTTPRR